MTPQAREAILAADRVVGYLTYLDLIKDLIEGKETVGTAMMQEVCLLYTSPSPRDS